MPTFMAPIYPGETKDDQQMVLLSQLQSLIQVLNTGDFQNNLEPKTLNNYLSTMLDLINQLQQLH